MGNLLCKLTLSRASLFVNQQVLRGISLFLMARQFKAIFTMTNSLQYYN